MWCETSCYACVGECASKVSDNSIPDDVGKPEDISNASEPDNRASEGLLSTLRKTRGRIVAWDILNRPNPRGGTTRRMFEKANLNLSTSPH